MIKIRLYLLSLIVSSFLLGCKEPEKQPLFEDMAAVSGIDFSNDLHYTEAINPYTFRNFYNGGGVGLGDINNDGLLDIYFTGNMVSNKLYLNKGNWQFEDITAKAGVACEGVWSTGVTFVDINGDGLLDMYVCKSGSPGGKNRHNELFINNGDLTFTERSKEYGLDIVGLSMHAAFFDYDKDGDLDCYILTNSIKSVGNYDMVAGQREIPDAFGGGNKFLVNDNGQFKDFTAEAGIFHSDIGFGLGITLGDFNADGWTDIFISNDFFEKDYLYINNTKGGFDESLEQYFQSISMGSMGADYADLDNDGKPELFVTEMLPDSLSRKKTKTVYESWDKYALNVSSGYYHQFPRNVLQKKIGKNEFVELGRFSGIAATEWSWGALMFDMDNDGLRDLYISNGIFKDLLDRDYLTYTATDANIREMIQSKEEVIKKLVDQMPSGALPNYTYKNLGNLKFENVSDQWNLTQPSFSNGSAYGDLDNDGDLDLVVNNIDLTSFVFRNNTDTLQHRSLRIRLTAADKNTWQLGAHVVAKIGNDIFTVDNFTSRGFQSSVDPTMHIGLGPHQMVDSLFIYWPAGGYSILNDIKTNQLLTLEKEKLEVIELPAAPARDNILLFTRNLDIPFRHQSNSINDFNRERLLPWMYSNAGPGMAIGDINSNGSDEIFIGGGKGQASVILSTEDEKMKMLNIPALEKDQLAEDISSVFFDADNDGDLDLYVAAGGRSFPKSSSALMDRLYINDGHGNFELSKHRLPFKEYISTSMVKAADFNNDGFIDLFVGERFHPFYYGIGGRGYIFQNDGTGKFTDVTSNVLPALADLGMVTDAAWMDINGDGFNDLVVVGDWMPIKIYIQEKGKFIDQSAAYGMENTRGWWNTIASGDLNNDGKVDFIVGNHGTNSFFRSGDRMYVHDFDANGSIEQIFCTRIGDKYYPVIDKDELISQIPSLKKKLLFYKLYGKLSIEEIFGSELEQAKIFEVDLLESMQFLSKGNSFEKVPLPAEAQYSSIYSLLIEDINEDGTLDVIAGGNNFLVKPRYGRFDGSKGWYFEGVNKKAGFTLKNGQNIGVNGEIRAIVLIEMKGKRNLMFTINNGDVISYEIDN